MGLPNLTLTENWLSALPRVMLGKLSCGGLKWLKLRQVTSEKIKDPSGKNGPSQLKKTEAGPSVPVQHACRALFWLGFPFAWRGLVSRLTASLIGPARPWLNRSQYPGQWSFTEASHLSIGALHPGFGKWQCVSWHTWNQDWFSCLSQNKKEDRTWTIFFSMRS